MQLRCGIGWSTSHYLGIANWQFRMSRICWRVFVGDMTGNAGGWIGPEQVTVTMKKSTGHLGWAEPSNHLFVGLGSPLVPTGTAICWYENGDKI